MTGFCTLCGLMVPALLPPDAPIGGAERLRLELLVTGHAAFGHLVRDHTGQAERLLPILSQIQSLIGLQFVRLPDPGPVAGGGMAPDLGAAVEELRADLVAWLSRQDAIQVSEVMPPAAGLPLAA